MKDQLSIKVSIAGRIYPLTIERTEEENVRKAVKNINDKVTDYEKNFNIKDRQDLLAMSSLHFATHATEIHHNTSKDEKSIMDRLEKIDKAVSGALKV